ncbi:hypothetical protein CBOM_07862 [Ceraceosorus bombacis]|uniref:Uncharacterized protein n=1 Tax=Ceraceosorus bombacis TaxID=401625 RepID=A0A0P1BQ16_9BASI|nr:hypothetical protein CBOM_07862 [Ceraceosorus bombacis]
MASPHVRLFSHYPPLVFQAAPWSSSTAIRRAAALKPLLFHHVMPPLRTLYRTISQLTIPKLRAPRNSRI